GSLLMMPSSSSKPIRAPATPRGPVDSQTGGWSRLPPRQRARPAPTGSDNIGPSRAGRWRRSSAHAGTTSWGPAPPPPVLRLDLRQVARSDPRTRRPLYRSDRVATQNQLEMRANTDP